jgi:hypothetical protein
MTSSDLVIFGIFLIVIVYLINCVIVRGIKKISPSRALLYISTVAMIGVFGEIFVDTIYAWIFGNPLWIYNVLPIHHGYTSQYAVVLWGIYGFYLYMLHDSLGKWSRNTQMHLALIFSFEALVLEAAVELISKGAFGQYVYYYYPGDLWHISTVQNFPFYLICGYLIVRTIHRFKADPRFFTIIATWVTVILVFFR